MNSKDIAFEKAKLETRKTIDRIKALCNHLSFGELAYCIYYLHVIRILKHGELKTIENMSVDRFNDVLKHSISCIYKYSNILDIPKDNYTLDITKSIYITKIVNHLHSLHETTSFITIMDDVELKGERNQHIKIDLLKIMENPRKKKIFEYVARFQKSIIGEKEKPLFQKKFLNDFTQKYSQYNLISKDIFGLEVREITNKLNDLLNICVKNMKKNVKNMVHTENGNIDVQHEKTLRQTINSFIIDEKDIIEIFGKNGMRFIRDITFKKSDFKSHELNYHYILRNPLIKIKNKYIVVPELLLDSLFSNFHYTLLENNNYKEKHKKIMSDSFVNEIVNIGSKYGFKYFDSELELYKRKNKLGDIDLILRHESNDFDILIEAKNHAIPIPVYYGDYNAVNKRLEELKESWEKKVHNRYTHLIENYSKYNIKKDFKYIIVSRYPEVLAHFSDYLVLSLKEFDFFLQNKTAYSNFYDLHAELYKHEDWGNKDDISVFMKEVSNLRLEE